MSLMLIDVEKCMSGELKPVLRLDYTNKSMYEHLPLIRNLVLLWCNTFFGEYYNTLTSLLVMHRVVFDIDHMRQFDEVNCKIYDKYFTCEEGSANQKYIKNLFAKLVERMATHYQSAIIQEAVVVQVKEVEIVPQEAIVVEENKTVAVVEQEYQFFDTSSFDGISSIKLSLQSYRAVESYVHDYFVFPYDKLLMYASSNQFLENHNYNVSTRNVVEGLSDSYEEYFGLLGRVKEALRLSPKEEACYTLFAKTVFYDYRNHIVFTNFWDINSILLEGESFASIFKMFLSLSCFSCKCEIDANIGDMLTVKFNCLYSHFVNYYKHGFSFNSLTVLKPFKPPHRFEKFLFDYHLNGTCIGLEVYLFKVHSVNYELFVADYYDNDHNWHSIFESFSTSQVQCDIRFYYLINALRLFWPDLGEGFVDGNDFTEIFEFVLDKMTGSEYQPQFCFVIMSHGTCCQPLDNGYMGELYEPESYQSNSGDDPPYLREYSSED